ncbi:hypothetical protein CPB84DRAFT_1780971 [Gymnopilus junonius]|uniref:Uncharacterized protein n=1 Tax=Gymnopilus junonius TaxID=109634 RepID=A0A9P5NLG8_GYMJU|nr:hypothetical protein CPB84DRAFT_1780971 [Gymnopilus junonius]
MSLSLARFPYISSGMIFAGLSSPTVHVALSSINTASYTMPSNLKGRDRIGRIRKMAAFTGAAGLLAQTAFGNDPIGPFYGTKRPFTRIGANGYSIHNTFASGEPDPSRTSGRRGRGGSSSRDASLDGFRGRNYHLRSHTRAANDNGLPPGEDPQGDPPLPSVSGGPGPPSRPSSPTAPHAPIQGSGPPPPPPPPPSITSEVDDGKPLSVTLNVWGHSTQVAFHKSEARSNTRPPFRTPTTGHTIPLAHESSIRQHSHVCSTSLAEVPHFCIRPSFVASHPPSMLKGFLASFRDYIVPILPLIILYLLSVICCLSGLFEDSEKATVSHEQLALNLDKEEMQEHICAQSNWSTDASLEIGRVDVDEFLVPMLDDIKASLFAKWTIVDTELHDGADFLRDNAFLENSTSTDWDDLVDDGTFLQETAVRGLATKDPYILILFIDSAPWISLFLDPGHRLCYFRPAQVSRKYLQCHFSVFRLPDPTHSIHKFVVIQGRSRTLSASLLHLSPLMKHPLILPHMHPTLASPLPLDLEPIAHRSMHHKLLTRTSWRVQRRTQYLWKNLHLDIVVVVGTVVAARIRPLKRPAVTQQARPPTNWPDAKYRYSKAFSCLFYLCL